MADQRIRTNVPVVHNDDVEHRRQIALRLNATLTKDGTNAMTNPLVLVSYTVSGLPDAGLWEGGMVYVSDETGGAIPAFSDGTNWRRVSDRAIVS